MQGTQFNIDSMQRTTDDVSQCTPSVECGDYRNEAAAVVDIYAIDMRLGAMGLCTGGIIQPGPSDEASLSACTPSETGCLCTFRSMPIHMYLDLYVKVKLWSSQDCDVI